MRWTQSFPLALLLLAVGCTSTGAPVQQAQLITLAEQQTSPALIHQTVRNNGLAFPLTAQNIVFLKSSGLSDAQLEAVLRAAVDIQTGQPSGAAPEPTRGPERQRAMEPTSPATTAPEPTHSPAGAPAAPRSHSTQR